MKSSKKSLIAGFILGWMAGWVTPKLWISALITLCFLAGMNIPIAEFMKEWSARNAVALTAAKLEKIRINTDYWNSFVEPARQLCLKQGGMPYLDDVPSMGRWDWQVSCEYPTKSSPKDIAEWVHHNKSVEGDMTRTRLRDLGWKCC